MPVRMVDMSACVIFPSSRSSFLPTLAHPGPGNRAVKRSCACVVLVEQSVLCVCVCVLSGK